MLTPGMHAGGNQLLWGYNQDMDAELQQVFNFVVDKGINLFDTADSYGTGQLNGQSEKLLGQFTDALPARQQGKIAIATKIAPYPWRLTAGELCSAQAPGSVSYRH